MDVVYVIFAVVIIYALSMFWISCVREDNVRKIVKREVEKHVDVLAKKRLQTLKVDDYGRVDSKKWNKEVQYFVDNIILEALTPRQIECFAKNINDLANTIIEPISREACIKLEERLDFESEMSPVDFEHFCANELRKAGWSASVTQASGDQGVDVIAEKNSLTISIQCKKYSRPVGNSAVQETVAAKQHTLSQYAAVVTNSTYTRSAKDLARTNKVLLLHYSDLANLENLILRTKNREMTGHDT